MLEDRTFSNSKIDEVSIKILNWKGCFCNLLKTKKFYMESKKEKYFFNMKTKIRTKVDPKGGYLHNFW